MSSTIKVLCENNAYGSLAAAATATSENFFLAGDQGDRFPTPVANESMFYATLEDTDGNLEIVAVTKRIGSTFTVTRAQAGTEARAWAIGTEISLRVTAELLEDKVCLKDFKAEQADKDSSVTEINADISNLSETKLDKTTFETHQASIDAAFEKYTAEYATYDTGDDDDDDTTDDTTEDTTDAS